MVSVLVLEPVLVVVSVITMLWGRPPAIVRCRHLRFVLFFIRHFPTWRAVQSLRSNRMADRQRSAAVLQACSVAVLACGNFARAQYCSCVLCSSASAGGVLCSSAATTHLLIDMGEPYKQLLHENVAE